MKTGQAATFAISFATPVLGSNDVCNFSGASRDQENVSDGGAYANGLGNDAFTYVAGDRPDQGQTFTTGTNTNGYMLMGIWLRHVGYTNNDALTYWRMDAGVTLTVRITDPGQAGTAGFAVRTESYVTTGTEGWAGGYDSNNGDGQWVHVTFDSPVRLLPNKTYGFDLASPTTSAFFEWLGTSNDVYAGGGAYNGGTVGGADNIMKPLVGDRVFLVSMTAATNPAPPFSPLTAQSFDLTNVTLLPSSFQTNMLLDKEYLLSLNADRLLYNFRANVHLSTSNAAPYGGWEAPGSTLCLGHFVGHYLSACSMMYASTGDPQLKARTDFIVADLAKCQAVSVAAGFHTGYLSAFPESYIDDVINGAQSGYFSVPWYTLHKIMAGLLDAYQHTGNGQALTVLTNMANWVQFRMDKLSASQIQAMLNYREYGGMNEVLANLYAVTGNANYLRIAADFDKQSLFSPLSQHQDVLDGLHANTQIPEIIGAAREYEMTGVFGEHETAAFFWDRVANYRSYAIGGNSDNEHFFPVADFPSHVTAATCETCNTYNMLKLTRHLFEWSPSAVTMDFYERALYNQILGSETAPGEMTYFVSLKPGHFKTYSTTNNSFWCCDGTGVENHAKYGDTIYFHGSNSLYLNLFIPSQLNWPEKGLTVAQHTGFPQSDTTTLTFQCTNGMPLTLYVRYPSWAQAGMNLSINGVSETVTNAPGSYVSITRSWSDNDEVEIRFPMTLRTENLPGASNLVALFYGPILLAGALGTNGMPANDVAANQGDLLNIKDPLVSILVGDTNSLLSSFTPVPGQPLTFKSQRVAQPNDFTLIPFYEIQHQRYSVYWNVMSESQWQQFAASNAVAEAEVVDQVGIGDPASETLHNLVASNSTTGVYAGLNWRDANENFSSSGWFSYSMATLPDAPISIACTYWGSDSGNRAFDVFVDDTMVATQILTNNDPGQFFTITYPVPTNLTAGKTNITIKFAAHAGQIAGGVFGLQTVVSTNPGTFLGIRMDIATNQIFGSPAPGLAVTDYFEALTNHSIIFSPWLTITSSNPNVIQIGPNNQLMTVGVGTTVITANYLGSTTSQIVIVSPATLGVTTGKNGIQLSWPSNSATLQSSPGLNGNSNWTPVAASKTTVAGTDTVAVPITNSAQFFRLAY